MNNHKSESLTRDVYTTVKDLHIFLSDIKNVFLDTKILYSGEELPRLNLRPREAMALFLICSVGKEYSGKDVTISSDPYGRDGVIVIKDSSQTHPAGLFTEHVFICKHHRGNLNRNICNEIENKSSPKKGGKEYSRGLELIILLDKDGEIKRNRITRKIKETSFYRSYWIIFKVSKTALNYILIKITPKGELFDEVLFKVTINKDFKNWRVKQIGYNWTFFQVP